MNTLAPPPQLQLASYAPDPYFTMQSIKLRVQTYAVPVCTLDNFMVSESNSIKTYPQTITKLLYDTRNIFYRIYTMVHKLRLS